MSDFEHSDDELVSADLDGEATAEESARVAADPALARRRATFQTIAEGIGDVPEPPAALRDHQIEVALAAFAEGPETESPAAAEPAPPAPPPASLAARRRRRQVALLSAAAVLLVAFLGVAVYRATGGDDDQQADLAATEPDVQARALDTTGAGETESEAASEATDDAAAAPLGDADASGIEPALPATGPGIIDLGSFSTADELAVAVTGAIDDYLVTESGYVEQGRRPPFAPSTTADLDPSSPTASCVRDLTSSDDEVGTLLWVGSAELTNEPVTIVLFEVRPESAANGLLRLYTIDAACHPIPEGIQTFTP